MKIKIHIILLFAFAMSLGSCTDDFLDSKPQGKLSDAVLVNSDAIDALCTAAYASLAGPGYDYLEFLSPTTNWIYGDVRAETAYKGGGGITDIWEFHSMETFTGVDPTMGPIDRKWFNMYISVQRANSAIRQLNVVNEEDVPLKDTRLGEMKFLRAHYFFELSRLFNKIPYFDENVEINDYPSISNVEYTRDEILEKITAEFKEAADLLPETQPEIGRVTKYAALAYAAKASLYRAYVQNENNQVVAVDNDLLLEVIELCDQVAEGPYDLLSDFKNLQEVAYEHGSESLFGIEYSINDGTDLGRINWSNLVCTPRGPLYSGDGFYQPSQNLVNSYKTTTGGVPDFDNYLTNGNMYSTTDGFKFNLDPRLDFSIGRLGTQWKNYTKRAYDATWVREPATYGTFACKKFVIGQNDPNMVLGWPWGGSSLNFQIIRYADVLLWKAEALIELGRQAEALPIINRIRQRTMDSEVLAAYKKTTPAANYVMDIYKPGINCSDWSQEYARKALRFERKLELALEGERFFDLVRWGAAEATLNEYFLHEKEVRSYITDETKFIPGRDEYLPIPQAQISLSGGLYTQNPGYSVVVD